MTLRSRGAARAAGALLLWLAAAGAPGTATARGAAAAAPPRDDTEVITLPAVPRTGGGEMAAGGAEAVPAAGQGVNAREVLSGLWFKYQGLRQRGATREAASLIDTAVAFMRREGLRASPEIAAAFLAIGRRAHRNGDDATAVEDFRLALRFDPERADARFALAGALLRGARDLPGGLRAVAAGVRALVVDPESLFYLGGAAALILYLGICAGLAAAVVLIALRARTALAHDVKERLSGRAPEGAGALAAWAVLALPLLLLLPFPWALAFWAALFLVYVRRWDRLVIGAALLSLLLAGAFGAAVAWHFDTATDPAARALLHAARSGADLRQEEALKAAMDARPRDPIYPFLLATAYRVGGRFEDAMAMYEKVLQIDPTNARAMVNLANLHALRQEFAQAQTLYKKASEEDPSLALAHYDSHLAHLETFNMEAADAELRAARQADDALITRLIGSPGPTTARRTPLDALYPPREIWARAIRLRLPPARQVARAALVNPTSLAGAVGLLALLLIPGLFLAPRTGAASTCRLCGRGFCRRCQMNTRFPGHCAPCVHLFILRDGLPPPARDRKMEEVARYRRNRFLKTRLLSLLVPGGGHVLGGRPLAGAALLILWATAWAGLMLRGRLLVPPGFRQGTALTVALVILLALALAAWVTANLSRQEAAE